MPNSDLLTTSRTGPDRRHWIATAAIAAITFLLGLIAPELEELELEPVDYQISYTAPLAEPCIAAIDAADAIATTIAAPHLSPTAGMETVRRMLTSTDYRTHSADCRWITQ